VNPAITRDPTFLLTDITSALRSVEDGHARGKVPITAI
jgi:hypothetical protein